MTDANKPDVVLYHANCIDGFTAAWAINTRWPDVPCVPVSYGDAPPDVAGKRVLICDFSYKAPVLVDMSLTAAGIVVLDHHLSAQKDLAAFIALGEPFTVPLTATFDMNKSGAMLAWEYAHPARKPRTIVEHVQDRDLWRFALHGTKEIHASLALLPMDMAVWYLTADQLQSIDGWNEHYAMGSALMRQATKNCMDVIGASKTMRVITGHLVPVVNAPHYMASEIGNILAPGHPFSACYYDTASGKRAFSLRSTDAGEDVSAICAKLGGGGHRNAAGFAVDLDGFTWEAV